MRYIMTESIGLNSLDLIIAEDKSLNAVSGYNPVFVSLPLTGSTKYIYVLKLF